MIKKIRVYLNLDEQNKDDIKTYNMLSLMFDSPQKRNKFVTECVKKELLAIGDKFIDENETPEEKPTRENDIQKTRIKSKLARNDFRKTILSAKDKLLTTPQ
jgi:hypothetical protein